MNVTTKVRARPQRTPQSPRDPLRTPAHQPAATATEREPVHEPPARTRRRKLLTHDDQFWLPVDEIPETHKAMFDGSLVISYEWKRFSNMGQEDPFYIAMLREQGWEPVEPKKHPNWLPPGYDKPQIIKGGLILMERPIELSIQAKQEEKAASKQQIREAEARLGMTPKGELTRNFPGVEPTVTKEYMRPVMIRGED